MNSDLLKLSQWLSPGFPVGGFAYSHGLEQAIDGGVVCSAATLQDWLSQVLQFGSGLSDAVFVCRSQEGADLADLCEAMAPSKERLEETRAQGAAFARTVSAILPEPVSAAPLPVAVGCAARQLSLTPETVAGFYLHAFAANLVTAAVRFVPLGQTEGQVVLANLHGVILRVAEQAVQTPINELGTAAIGSDMAAMHHETMEVRLFKS